MTADPAIATGHNRDGAGAAHTILHADLDAFFAAVEQRDHPEWRGRPVIVGAAPDRRGVVAAASYEARRFGIHSAMPSRDAGARCPDAVFVPPDMRRYREASRAVFACFELYTPWIEPLSIDEAFLDVSGSLRLFGSALAIGRLLKSEVLARVGLTISVGIAPNKFLAKLAGEQGKPDGLVEAPRDPRAIREFLAPLPVDRLWGVGVETLRRLQAAGVQRIADLQSMATPRLTAIVGSHAALHFKALAEGIDTREVAATPAADKSLSRELTFEHDCRDPRKVVTVACRLADEVGARLRKRNLYASVVRVKVRYKGFRTLTRQMKLPRPCRDDAALRDAARTILARVDLNDPVRLIGFGVAGLDPQGQWQPDLFGETEQHDRQERLSRSLDRVRERFGDQAIRRGDPSA